MADKEEKPFQYERRILDTKGIAQRLDLDYLRKPNAFRDWRRRLTWMAPLAAAVAVAPFIAGVGDSGKVFSNGSVTRAHRIFEGDCAACHTELFSSVSYAACARCHAGPPHPAKAIDTARPARSPRCASCHVEHRGERLLAEVADGNCTSCHADLASSATGVKLAGVRVTAFRQGRHPEFSPPARGDRRPLKLNHAAHMPGQRKTVRGRQLPMRCEDCHTPDPASRAGDLLPVRFRQHCERCHSGELEFDPYGLLGGAAVAAPHTGDSKAIRDFIAAAFAEALARDPELVRRPIGRLVAGGGTAGWLEAAAGASEQYLFRRKCIYCHELEPEPGGDPVMKPVAVIRGRYAEGQPAGEPWLLRGEFSHRAHRAMDCASCHTAARASTRTSDVLIPAMRDCLKCHGSSGTHLDRCSQCHLYHNKSKEFVRVERAPGPVAGPVAGVVGRARRPVAVPQSGPIRIHWGLFAASQRGPVLRQAARPGGAQTSWP
jgi:hypothetical protein